jgi:uncharacterized protein (DUF2252 family)
MAGVKVRHESLEERRARGRRAAERTPFETHEKWEPAVDRPDPVDLLEQQNQTREPDLVPVRHGRMLVSPFTFYRGAAKIMAADLEATPTAGLTVQLCGDAHLSNFGGFASPERTLLFDLNDFDETLPGPFEFDVKRLAASFTIAARNNGFAKHDANQVTRSVVRAYREAMAGFAQMRTMDVWYAHLTEGQVLSSLQASPELVKDSKAVKRGERTIEKAHTRDSLQALGKLAERVDGALRIVNQPPIVVPLRELAVTYGMSEQEVEPVIREQFRSYRATLPDDRRHLLERFRFVDAARKVVGVGSVGTRAFILLFQGRDEQDVLFLQVKEATSSVYEDHMPKSRYRHHGERVVQGQRLMQAASDIFLGWTKGLDSSRHFYLRQLRDMKASARVDRMDPPALDFYAGLCGWTLARAHARSGDPVAISEYLGDVDGFDRSVARFAIRYADQNERDYAEFARAVKSARVRCIEGV